MKGKPKPASPDGIRLRYRSVWPQDRQAPILDATADCVLRLLCSSATDGFAAGQIAFGIERKIKAATEKHMERIRPIQDDEAKIRKRFEGTQDLEALKACEERHRERIVAALEGECFELTGPEVGLLRRAVEVCHRADQYQDPSRRMTPELLRWYAPILSVIMGAETESERSAPDIPPSWLEGENP